MKAEINNENKAKFFALYWGQKILTTSINLTALDGKWIDKINSGECDASIELKSLSSISDEDAVELGVKNALRIDEFGIHWINGNFNRWSPEDVDFLRYNGYLIPWMGLSSSKLIKAGWAKYKEL